MTMLLNHKEVKRIMVVPDAEHTDIWHTLAAALNRMDDDEKHITLFAMQPMEARKLQTADSRILADERHGHNTTGNRQ